MPFDIEGARKAGYSETEIADHLASQAKFDAASARKSGYSDADIVSHLSKTETPKRRLSDRAQIANVPELISKTGDALGGTVTDLLAPRVSPEVAAGAGAAVNALTQAAPMAIGAPSAVGGVAEQFGIEGAKNPLRWAAEKLMHSSLKPSSKAIRTGQAEQAVNTLLDEGINVTKGGVQKAKGIISNLNDEISAAIAKSPATVDKNKVASALNDTIAKFERQADPSKDVAAIESVWTNFLNHPLIQGQKIPVKLAQELKQGTYRVLEGKYGEMGSAATEAQKAVARGLRQEISAAVPEVAELNAREASLLRALKLTEHRVGIESNKNPAGLSWIAQNPKLAAMFMLDRSAAFKSAFARLLNSASGIPADAAVKSAVAGSVINEQP